MVDREREKEERDPIPRPLSQRESKTQML